MPRASSASGHLYLHIPFCLRRCSYCDFPSSTYDPETALHYLDALEIELRTRAPDAAPRTLYIGGGTPTSLDPPLLDRLLRLLESLDLSRLEECTIEANPCTITMEKALRLRNSPVNRVSLGVQTFHPDGLEILGRIHTARQARTALAQLREAGFDAISLDFIYGWPGQSLREWYTDLRRAIDLGVPHLSCYCLNYPVGTPLHALLESGGIDALHESTERRLFDLTRDVLRDAGVPPYEISNFARPGQACRHNLCYWTGGSYLGLGAGAHSHEKDVRFANLDQVNAYIDAIRATGQAVAMTDTLAPEKRARECAAIWLRLQEGIDRDAFHARTGYAMETLLRKELPGLLAQGWLAWSEEGSHLALTEQAVPLADSVLAEIVGDG